MKNTGLPSKIIINKEIRTIKGDKIIINNVEIRISKILINILVKKIPF